MDQFFTAINAMPTAIFSGLVLVVLLYWILAAIGQVDIDSLNVDVDADVDVDVDAEVSAPNGMTISAAGILDWLSVGKVPVSFIASTWILTSWLLCMCGEYLLRELLTTLMPNWTYALSVGVVAPISALILTAYIVRPLRRVFERDRATTSQELVGRQVTITSRTADEKFGRAVALIGGSEIILDVLCRPGVRVIRDDHVVVVDYNSDRNVYLIAPLPHLQAGFLGDENAPVEPPNDAAKASEPVSPPRDLYN